MGRVTVPPAYRTEPKHSLSDEKIDYKRADDDRDLSASDAAETASALSTHNARLLGDRAGVRC